MRINTQDLTFTATTALAPHLRVKLTAGKLVAAGAADNDLGVLAARVLAADAQAAVVPRNAEGTVRMVAADAITQFALVYGAAGGKIDDVANGNLVGMALDAATADGDYVEVLRLDADTGPATTTTYGTVLQAAVDADIADSSGGSAGNGLAAVTAAAAIADNSGGVDPGDDTIAVVTPAAAITDNSGGVDPGDDTIAVVTNLDTLTNSTGGSADNTLAAVTQQAGGAGVELTDGDAAKINDNFTELADQVATQAAANTAITAAVAQLAAKQNTASTAMTAITAAAAQLAAKQNVTSTAVGVLTDAVAALAAEINDLKAKLRTSGALATA